MPKQLPRFDADAWFLKPEVTSTYESWYDGKYKRADTLEKRLLRQLLWELRDVGKLLEVGCGTTHFTRWFEALGVEAFGLDISPAMLKVAKTLWRGSLIRGDSAYLPFREKAFDAVAFITCFEYMPFPRLVLIEAERIARKGFIMGMMNKHSIPTLRRRIQVLLGRNPYYRNAYFYSIGELKKLFRSVFDKLSYEVKWWTTFFPRPLPINQSKIPYGGFLGVGLRFLSGVTSKGTIKTATEMAATSQRSGG